MNGAFFYLKKNDKKFRLGVEALIAESEESSGIYTGKIREVYDPLDQAYIKTDKLKQLIKESRPDPQINDLPTVSLYVDPIDLLGRERGIFHNGKKRGRLWERAAFVKIIENDKLLYADDVGIRIHGGSSRSHKVSLKSFRIYARKKYKSKPFPKNFDLSLGHKGQIRRLVIRRDTILHFANEISYFLINSLGGIAPKSKQVSFYLNGEFQGFHILYEHLSPEQLVNFIGHPDFALAKMKGDKKIEDRLSYLDLRSKLESSSEMDFAYAKDSVDIDSVMSSLLVIMYTGMSDWAQGTYIKDLRKKDQWRLISWDFDRAFYPVKGESYDDQLNHDYEVKSIALGMDMKKGTVRWSIFNRLIKDDKQFRTYFSGLVNKLFDQVLVGQDFKKLIETLEQRSRGGKETQQMREDLTRIQDFMKNRKKIFCQDLKRLVKLTPTTCTKN